MIKGMIRIVGALGLAWGARLGAVTVAISLSPSAGLGSIPPLVYGCNHFDVQGAVPLRRFGGNRVTGYNWENNASNAGTDYLNNSDYYLLGQVGLPQNGSQAPAAVPINYVKEFRALGSQAEIVSVPIAGYVAADAAGPVTAAQTAPSSRWDLLLPHKPGWPASLSLTPNTTDGVVYTDEQIHALVAQFGPASSGGIRFYDLDNEPDLWASTHPYLHPAAATYAEVLARCSSTAAAILDIDPSAQILGPASYGWAGYMSLQNASDSGADNATDDWFLGWYLAQMKAASTLAGRRLLHYLDLHWYPEAQSSNGVRIDQGNPDPVDQAGSVARMQAPRSLWDPTYVENSWIASGSTPWSPVWPGDSAPIELIPRLQHYVNADYPGTGISFSEYDYGAPYDVSGGIAEADALGIFGKYGTPACRWGYSSVTSYAQAAYNLYLNYDGAGSAFGDESFNATTSDGSETSVYAAKRSADPELLTVVLLNKDYSNPVTATVSVALNAGQSIQSISVRRFDPSGSALYSPAPPVITGGGFTDVPPARSASLYVIRLISAGSPTSTHTPSPSATPTATITPTSTPTASPSETLTPSPCATVSPTFSASPTASPTFSASPSPTASPTVTPTPLATYACPRVNMAFYPYYNAGLVPPSQVPWGLISHLAHAFVGVNTDGSLTVPAGFLDPSLNAAAHAHGVKILVSLGGAGSGPNYSAMAASAVSRAAFIANVYAFMLANAYDGVDLDYEFPSNAADSANLDLLVQALRAKFSTSPAPAPGWLITGDLNWGSYYGQWWDVATLKNSMDWFNLMEYDMFGTWAGYSGHNGPLNDSSLPGGSAFTGTNGTWSVNYYLGRGVPPQQLVYGIAGYGYRYDTNALYQPCAGGNCGSANEWSYSAIAPLVGAGWTRSWDASASSPYLSSADGLQVVSYDDPQSVLAKAQAMVWGKGLGGTFIWEISQDSIGGTHPLVQALATAVYCAPYTPTLTATPTPSPTAHGTATATPTPPPAASPTPTPGGGPLVIGQLLSLPQPNPRRIDVLMHGPADSLSLRLYSVAFVQVRPPLLLKHLVQGWNQADVETLTAGLPNGIYFLLGEARRGGSSSPLCRGQVVILQ